MDTSVRPHQGGWLLGLALLGLVWPLLLWPFALAGLKLMLLAPPMCIGAFFLGRSDLRAMKAGSVDPSGRRITCVASVIAILGTLLWSSLLVLVFVALASGAGVGPL